MTFFSEWYPLPRYVTMFKYEDIPVFGQYLLTYLLTYLLHGAESFIAFYGTTRKFITVLTSARHLSLS